MKIRQAHGALLAAVLAVVASTTGFADPAADERARMLDILRYGIDSQVLTVVSRVRETRDASWGPSLAEALAQSRSTDVRKAILDACAELGMREGEEAARSIVAAGENENAIVVSAAVSYLTAIGAGGLTELLLPLVESTDAPLASAAIHGLGAARDAAAVAPLLAKLSSPTFPASRKGEVVRALGELRDPRAVDPLLALASSTDTEQFQRLSAIEALGRIGDLKAVPVLRELTRSDNALVRAYVAGALAALALPEALPSLLAGLRDENAQVRLACAKGLGTPLSESEAGAALPILSWKVRNDPDRQVRLQSIASLGETARPQAAQFLRSLLADGSAPTDSREAALAALVKHPDTESVAAVTAAVRAAIGAEGLPGVQSPQALQSFARVLATASLPALEPVYVDMLGSRDFAVRIAAIRGIASNGLAGQRQKLSELAAGDPHPAVRTEASRALAKLSSPGLSPAEPTSSTR